MANRKISDLTALTAPVTGDLLPIVDISEAAAADKNKKITIGELFASIPLGTAAAPSVAFEGDPNTGIYSPGADQLAISTNGTSRLVVDASGNVNIDSNTFYVDAANNRVGIGGITSPIVELHVTGEVLAGYSGATKFVSLYPGNASQPPAIGFSSADSLRFVGTAEYARIDSSGRLLVGTSSSRGNWYNSTSLDENLQIEGTTHGSSGFSIVRSNNSGGHIELGGHGGTTIGSYTLVSSGANFGLLSFQGTDGTHFIEAASISASADGTPGADDMPGKLVFSTTADGSATPTEAMRIKSTQIINLSNAPTHADNTAATAAGLAVGDVYKTVLGVLMIRF